MKLRHVIWLAALLACNGDDGPGDTVDTDATADTDDTGTPGDTDDTGDTDDGPWDGRPGEGRWLFPEVNVVENPLSLPPILPGLTVVHPGPGQVRVDMDTTVANVTGIVVLDATSLPCTFTAATTSVPEHWTCSGTSEPLDISLSIFAEDRDTAQFMATFTTDEFPDPSFYVADGHRFVGLDQTCGASTLTPPSTTGTSMSAQVVVQGQVLERAVLTVARPASTAFAMSNIYGDNTPAGADHLDYWAPLLLDDKPSWVKGAGQSELAGYWPTTSVLQVKSGSAGARAIMRLYDPTLFGQYIVTGGVAPQQATRGLLEVYVTDAAGDPLTDVVVSVSGTYDASFSLKQSHNQSFASADTGTLTKDGRVYFSNVCPGMVTVSALQESLACKLGPHGGATSVPAPITAGEHTLVNLVCIP